VRRDSLLVVGITPPGNRDAGKFAADTTQLPTGCQPESLAKPARRRSHKATEPQLPTSRELDGRTRAAKAFDRLVADIESNLGGLQRPFGADRVHDLLGNFLVPVVLVDAPQISDRAVPFRSRLREIIRGRSEELEALAVEMYARGLSTRDIEALLPTSAANRC